MGVRGEQGCCQACSDLRPEVWIVKLACDMLEPRGLSQDSAVSPCLQTPPKSRHAMKSMTPATAVKKTFQVGASNDPDDT